MIKIVFIKSKYLPYEDFLSDFFGSHITDTSHSCFIGAKDNELSSIWKDGQKLENGREEDFKWMVAQYEDLIKSLKLLTSLIIDCVWLKVSLFGFVSS